MLGNYSKKIRQILEKKKIKPGHRVRIEKNGEIYEGYLMPKAAGDENHIVLKLDNGYNIGIAFEGVKIKKLKQEKIEKAKKTQKYDFDKNEPYIMIFHTGGTIASKIDYKTGAVTPLVNPEELVESIPEIKNIANFKVKVLFQLLSEDIEPEHWEILAKKIYDEIGKNCLGIIVTHGTDTMHYTSAAISFMLQNLPKPVIFVGSQRSSDRGSSDAAMNLICAAQFIKKTDFAGIGVCMHAEMDDSYCFIHDGVNARKMHTSRRDAFRSMDVLPIAKVYPSGAVEFLRDYQKRHDGKPMLKNKFSKKVALIKSRPGFSHKELEFYEKAGYKGIVFEGTGMGHLPVNTSDKYTKNHEKLLNTIKRMTKKGIAICMTTQCAYGRVSMDVYRTGRLLQQNGVIPLKMTPETAFVKLGWVLANEKEGIETLLLKNIAGEIVERIDVKMFLA